MSTDSNNRLISGILCAALFFLAWIFSANLEKEAISAVDHFHEELHKKEKKINDELASLASLPETKPYAEIFSERSEKHRQLYRSEDLVFLIYEADSLNYWSDHSVAVENYLKEVCLDDRVVQLKNGWVEVFQAVSKPAEKRRIYGLIFLKKKYSYENEYLVNEFPDEYGMLVNAEISRDTSLAHTVTSSDGKKLFGLVFGKKDSYHDYNSLSLLLYCSAIVLLLWMLKKECANVSKRFGEDRGMLLLAVSILLLRYFSLEIRFPDTIYNTPLFDPAHYGDATSPWLSSLGDVLINTLFGLFLALSLYRSPVSLRVKNKWQALSVALVLFMLLAFFGRKVNGLFTGLIQNSNISFHVNNLFSLSEYSVVAFLVIGILLFVFFLLTDKAVSVIRAFAISLPHLSAVFVLAGVSFTAYSHLIGSLDLVMILWPFLIILVVWFVGGGKTGEYSFAGIVFLVFLFSLYSVHILLKFSGMKELDSRKVYAEKLAAGQDPLAEHLFAEIAAKISADTMLYRSPSHFVFDYPNFEKKLLQKYFGGYWSKYEIRAYGFDTTCKAFSNNMSPERNDHAWFENLVKEKGLRTENRNLYSVRNPSGRLSYIADVPLYFLKSHRLGNVFIEMNLRFVSEEIGFPELLLDREIGINQELANYSYAKYKNDTLISYHGKYQYSLINSVFREGKENFSGSQAEGYDHLVYRADPDTRVIISRKSEGVLGKITTFSYLFTFFSLMLLVMLSAWQVISRGVSFSPLSFKNRIQYLLVLIVLISLTLFGAGTIFYIQQQFQAKNKESVNEKMFSALAEIEHELKDESVFRPGYREYLDYVLKRISSIVFTDINLYDTKGNVIASSLPKIFDEGLISGKMSPEAYRELAINQKMEYTHDEKIGNLEYLSAYAPVKSSNGKLLAYVNLPYFAKQNELEKEIATFLIALINIYVLLFVLSVAIAVLISNYVTNPLKLIQDKLSNIRLGKTNEPIEWKNEDEIGNLVKEYNRMIAELGRSAELLARSERESAWREMAKQVAHEIKNPLTPMKLSVQHLQRTWKDNAPDMGKKIESLTQTLIEQIDTLSHIASEFSSFAQMPRAVYEKVDLAASIRSVIELFRDTENVQLLFEDPGIGHCVRADKEQLIRVFNNLVKNAIQAIPAERKGKIEIAVERKEDQYQVFIRDNGSGISDEQAEKIFVPYFTTKTGGMGLGLAMVKNIVEGFGGKISFQTINGVGTTFKLELHSYKAKSQTLDNQYKL